MGQTFLDDVDDRPTTFPVTDTRDRADERHELEGFRRELDGYRSQVANFITDDPGDILIKISGISGRLAEIRAGLFRNNSQRAQALRIREVDPLREELEFQFRVWSRKIALLEWELKMSTGAP